MHFSRPLLLSVLVGLAACGDSSDIKSAIKQVAKDPDSLQYRNLAVNDDLACVEWNGKNSFGGFSGWSNTELGKENGKWVIKVLNSPFPECSVDHLKKMKVELAARATGNAAYRKASDEAIQLLVSSKSISRQVVEEMIAEVFPSECKKAHQIFSWGAKSLAVDPLSETERASKTQEIEKARVVLQNGNCRVKPA